MKKPMTAVEASALIMRFINNRPRYPQEWNDFVEASRVEGTVEPFRKRCYELDPLVNHPGEIDQAAIEELRRIAQYLAEI